MPEFPWPTEHFQGTPKYYNEAKQREIETLLDLYMQRHKPMSAEDKSRLEAEKRQIKEILNPRNRGARPLTNRERLDLKKELDKISHTLELASGFTLSPADVRTKQDRIGAIDRETQDLISNAIAYHNPPDAGTLQRLAVEKHNLEGEIRSNQGGKEFYTHRQRPSIMERPKYDSAGNLVLDAEGLPVMERLERTIKDTPDNKLASARAALSSIAAADFDTAKGRITGNEDAIEAARDLIGQGATAPGAENIAAYMNPYTDRAMENLEADTLRTLTEKLLPEVRGRNMGMNYQTGARQRQEERLLRDVTESLHRKRAEIQLHGQDQALKLASAGKERELTAGRAQGELASSQADRNIREADTLGNLEVLGAADRLSRADVQHQVAEREQQQLQRERDMQVQQFEREAEAPFIQAARYSALLNGQAAGLPTHTFQASSPGSAPSANLGTVAGGALTSLAGLAGMARQRGQGMFAKGGRVHRAEGGMMNQYGRGEWMKPPTEEEMAPYMASPELEQARAHYNTDNSPNPYWAGLAKMGANMMTHATKGPLEAFAASGPQFHEGFTGAMDERKQHAEKAAQFNMLLHKSRLDQKNAMMKRKYDNENMAMTESLKIKELGEMERLHDSQIEMHKAHANLYNAQAEPLNMQNNARKKALQSGAEVPAFKNEHDLKEDAKMKAKLSLEYAKQIPEIDKALQDVTQMQSLLPNVGSTGRFVGMLPNPVVTSLGGGDLASREQFEMLQNSRTLQAMAEQKGNQSDSDRQFIVNSIASLSRGKETNKENIETTLKIINRQKEYVMYMQDAIDKGQNVTQAQRKWTEYVNKNPIVQPKKEDLPSVDQKKSEENPQKDYRKEMLMKMAGYQ